MSACAALPRHATLGDNLSDECDRKLAAVVAEDEQISRSWPQGKPELGRHQLAAFDLHLRQVRGVRALARITTVEHASPLSTADTVMVGRHTDFLQVRGSVRRVSA